MTSSATPTERSPGRLREILAARADLVAVAALLLGGWLLVLFLHHWRLGAGAFFLCLGWLAILLGARFLWGSAQAAAGEGIAPEDEGEGFELSATRAVELEREKRALLKGIREVEFDREMGKMSEADAGDIVRIYRARAIEILKELEGEGGGAREDETVQQRIERELRARLVVAGVKKPETKPAEKKKETES
jgi:hypothetical protein